MKTLVTDVHYNDDGTARAAGILLEDWRDETGVEHLVLCENVAEYEPGLFYKRELPCLLKLLEKTGLPDLVVVDGHAWLWDSHPGLGAHLWEALGRKVPVIGVAKRPYTSKFGPPAAMPVLRRSGSKNPLWVSACGLHRTQAMGIVTHMHGDNRIPTTLKRVDRLCRDGNIS